MKARVDFSEGEAPEGSSDKEVALDALRESDSVDSELLSSLRLLTQLLQLLHKMTIIAMLALRSCLRRDGDVSGTG